MKAVLTAVLTVGLCVVAFAQDRNADPIGTWKCVYEIGGQKRESTLTIGKHADKFVGTMKWPDQKEASLADLKVKDAELTFSAVRELMDLKIPIKYTLKVEGDKIKGKGESAFSGEAVSFDIEGTREKTVDAKDAKKGR